MLLKPELSPNAGPKTEVRAETVRGRHRLWHLSSPFQIVVLDPFVAFLCMVAAFRFSPSGAHVSSLTNHANMWATAILFATTTFLASYAVGFGYYPNLRSRFRIVNLTFAVVFVSVVATLGVTSLIFYKQIGRYIVVISALLAFGAISVLRLFWFRLISLSRHNLVIWSSPEVSAGVQQFVAQSTFPIQVVAVIHSASEGFEVLGRLVAERKVHEIVVHGLDASAGPALLAALEDGVAVTTATAFVERHFFKTPIEFVTPDWFFQVDFKQHHPFYDRTKRLLDLGLSIAGLLVTAPIVVLAALAVKVETRGPAFYSQERVGLGGRRFTIWKLRTMRDGSEPAGPQWAKEDDPRVTRVGRILRKTRIDELPQLWNILVGEMSLVGPRPERPEFVRQLSSAIPFYSQRHLVKPGLTGWAQICYPYGGSESDAREKLSFDLYYLKNASILLDLQIGMQTIGAITKGSR